MIIKPLTFAVIMSGLLVACGGSDSAPDNASSSSSSSSSTASSASESSQSSSETTQGDENSLTIQEYDTGFCRLDGTVDSDNEGFTGPGFSNTDNVPDSAITYRVNVPEAGHYALEVRYTSLNTRPGDIQVNDADAGEFEFATTGSWTSWTTESQTVELDAGDNDIGLVATGVDGLPNVDALTVIGVTPTAVDCGVNSDGDGLLLPQDGNPVHSRFRSARFAWSQDKADIVLSYQYDHGGWPKNQDYEFEGSGGNDLGTIDNGATVTEMIYLAQVYKDTGETRYRDGVRKAMNYLLDAQYDTGGWPQYYPLRGGYSDHVTFNDNAMTRVLTALYHANLESAPFDTDLFTDSDRAAMAHAIERGVDYILQSQWEQNGELTVWCAQHGKDDYLPKAARAYELESLSGSESVEIIAFLMTQPQTPEVEAAVKAAIGWFRSEGTYLDDHRYDSSVEEKIVYSEGDRMWYRFYDLNTNEGFFSDRDGGKYYDIMEISAERRNGYSWGGSYGEKIISYADRVGY
ncbi:MULTISPECIES: pectate lyase [unclassified Marinimicrobium]|jgi:PelA/Pel-15E family pectate lyase|uniref:pectate lyase n=1 Tax=unclassified Marinimicrobium TaxID=2632100 RepID=UPI000C6ACDE6|nr:MULTISPECIES: pectate lyase [unclassified Marinimicrobium]MAN52043.1 pectate lyase [Marinimicrobium sp.]